MSKQTANQTRAYWLKTLHQWHWISSALCLLGILLFSVTGITLNHAAQIEATPSITSKQSRLPAHLQALLAAPAEPDSMELPQALRRWATEEFAVDIGAGEAEWSEEELYVSLPRPGGDSWLRVDRSNGEVEYESTDRGWISYLNDLHKGRHTGAAWSWFIDVFGAACLIFSITGFFILKLHAANRPTTWPIVGLGVMLPLLLAILFIH